VFPFVFLLILLAQSRGLALAIKRIAMSLVWIQLWPPLYAILNYALASARNLEAAVQMGTVTQGLALETAASIYSGAVSDQAIAGYMVISIPSIVTATIKGGEVPFQAITGVGAIQSAAAGEASATTKGNITQNAVSMDQQQLAPTRARAIQDGFEPSQLRSGTTSTSDGGSTSTQFQTLSSVARDVNRRLGLSDDSTVGKTGPPRPRSASRFR